MIAAIDKAAAALHLEVFGGLHPDPETGFQTILLLGPREPGFWVAFTATPEYRDAAPDPMNRWSRRVITGLARKWDAAPLFPFGGPPYQPFLHWALASGRAHGSPVGMLVHDRAGLMISYRGALGLGQRLDLPAAPPSPCSTCAGQPCRSACPVDALTGTYDVAACKADLERPGNDCMKCGCAVRRACPVSHGYGRLPEQSAFHMRHFK